MRTTHLERLPWCAAQAGPAGGRARCHVVHLPQQAAITHLRRGELFHRRPQQPHWLRGGGAYAVEQHAGVRALCPWRVAVYCGSAAGPLLLLPLPRGCTARALRCRQALLQLLQLLAL